MLNPIEEIKNRLDIVEVVQSYIKLQKAGANYRALCPFHSEKTPSFFVSPARQIWHCFGSCSDGGDLFKFVMKIEGVEFGDALRILADRAGVRLQRQDPRIRTERQQLYEISELACRFFEKQFQETRAGQKVKEYLLGRGITEDSIKKWRIGYAPDTWRGLSDFLVGRGYTREKIIKAGLAVQKEEKDISVNQRSYPHLPRTERAKRVLVRGKSASTSYDRFRGRIIFPIFDLNSQVIGFGGRVFGDKKETAKYVNSPGTLLYDKSRVLYGLDKAKVAIRKENHCILVEGYTDVVLASQAGFENVVATSGTALTPSQLKILKRYSNNLSTAFDMDIAGDTATKRGIDLALAQGFNIKVITIPEKKDPAEIITKNVEIWKERVAKAMAIVEFYFETTFTKFDSQSPEGKREISKIILPVLKRIPNKIEQSHWIQQLAKKLQVREENVLEELKKCSLQDLPAQLPEDEPPSRTPTTKDPFTNFGGKSRKERIEENIVSLVLKFPQKISLLDDACLTLFSEKFREILVNLKAAILEENKDIQEVIGEIQKTVTLENPHFIDYLFLKGEVTESVEPEKEIQACLQEIRSFEVKNKLDKISQAIKKAEQNNDSEKVEFLMKEFNNLSQQIAKG